MHSGIYIYGTGGHALSVSDVLLANGFSGTISYINQTTTTNNLFLGTKVFTEKPDDQIPIHIAIGNNQTRKTLFDNHSNFQSIISNKSYVSATTNLGENIFIGNFAHIGPLVTIGNNCIINTSAIIEHETRIGNHCHVAINAAIAGNVRLGDEIFIGAGATLINNINICSNVIIGAGAVVIKDIKEPGVYVGMPARKVK